ncbi:MAG: hypothetical protein AABZ32_06080 [Bacteroidota bacterium]
MLKLFSVFLLTLSPMIFMAQPPAKGPLDKKTFTVTIYKEGKKNPYDQDELKFNTGKFKSVFFADWGFTKASIYQIISVDSTSSPTKIYSWTAETISDIKEKMMWSGIITGEDIEGTSEVVNAKGETKYSFTFTGKLKKKPRKK